MRACGCMCTVFILQNGVEKPLRAPPAPAADAAADANRRPAPLLCLLLLLLVLLLLVASAVGPTTTAGCQTTPAPLPPPSPQPLPQLLLIPQLLLPLPPLPMAVAPHQPPTFAAAMLGARPAPPSAMMDDRTSAIRDPGQSRQLTPPTNRPHNSRPAPPAYSKRSSPATPQVKAEASPCRLLPGLDGRVVHRVDGVAAVELAIAAGAVCGAAPAGLVSQHRPQLVGCVCGLDPDRRA